MCYVLCVTCYVLRVMCYVLCVMMAHWGYSLETFVSLVVALNT